MLARLSGVLVAALLVTAALLPGMALAAEEGPPGGHEEMPSIEEIGSGSEIAEQFRPEPFEPPSITPKLVIPLLIVAFVATFAILTLYLLWQPRFARERKAKRRR